MRKKNDAGVSTGGGTETSLQLHTVAVFPSGRYAVTSSLLAFNFLFFKHKYRPHPGAHIGRAHWLPLFG